MSFPEIETWLLRTKGMEPVTTGSLAGVVALNRGIEESSRQLDRWALDFYLKIFNGPADRRFEYVQELCQQEPETVANALLVFFHHSQNNEYEIDRMRATDDILHLLDVGYHELNLTESNSILINSFTGFIQRDQSMDPVTAEMLLTLVQSHDKPVENVLLHQSVLFSDPISV